MKNKVRIFTYFLIGVVLLALPINRITALEYFTNDNEGCTETEEYKNWVKLPEDEKSSVMVPIRCKEAYDISKKVLTTTKSIGNVDYKNLTRFDLRDVDGKSYVTPVKNQMYDSSKDSSMCWAFATAAVVESAYLVEKNETLDLSEKHIAYNATRNLEDSTTNIFGYYTHTNVDGKDSGGSYVFSGTYLAQRRGPVLESKLPFIKGGWYLSKTSKVY